MTDALDAAQRTTLEKLVLRCRHLLETDLAQELERRYGIQRGGVVEPETNLTLDASDLESRRDLESVVVHLRSEGESASSSVGRLVREAAFTHLNRLVAVRIAEAIGMLPETLSGGIDSAGFRDFREVAPLAGSDDWDRFRLFLSLCADELAADVPALFDPRNPVLVLQPSIPTLVDLVETISDAPATIWDAPDTLGWVYQFFNTGDERRAMREASGAPRDSRELAVRNQFFTPRYVVDFLVQNGLGAHLASGIPDLVDDLPYLVEAPTEEIAIYLGDVSVLDPACGSGHFLLGAYDVLERAWEHAGVPPSESAPAIISSLWGIDIDPRCTQIAQAAIVFRARRHRRGGHLPLPNVFCARALPAGPEALALVASLPDGIGAAVRTISAELETAPVLGPLLKIEERLEHEIRASVFGGQLVEGTLAESLEGDAFTSIESQVLDALTAISNAATSTAAERLFAAEATDAVRFVEAMRRRYTAVLMNPPFGEPVPATKSYLSEAFKSSAGDLYAAFVDRGAELLAPGGSLGAITNRTGFYLSSLEDWRRRILDRGLLAFADLGSFVLEGAQVEVACYVVGRSSPTTTFLRGLLSPDKADVLSRRPEDLTFRISAEQLKALPGAWFDYWVGEEILSFFAKYPPLQSGRRVVSRGISAGDNFRFLRLLWELPPSARDRGWIPISKGGEFSRFWDDVHLALDWRNEDESYRTVDGARIFNLELQGQPAVYWPKRTTSLPSARPLPSGTFFEANSIPLFGDDLELYLSFANSRLFALLFLMQVGAGDVARGSAAKDWITGPARRIPWAQPDPDAAARMSQAARRAAVVARQLAAQSETSPGFRWPSIIRHLIADRGLRDSALSAIAEREDLELETLGIEHELDELWMNVYGCSPQSRAVLDRELEVLPPSYGDGEVDPELFTRAYLTKDPIDHIPVTSDARSRARARRQTTLRSLADLSHLMRRSPDSLVHARRRLGLVRDEDLAAGAQDALSYLLGCAVGRWDVRIALDPSRTAELSDIFAPVPVRPPGMLAESDHGAAGAIPSGYPLSLPPDRIVLDEPGHVWDIERRVRLVAETLLQDTDAALSELVSALGRRSLRHYLQTQFFKDHLSRYSMSRRAAPIYWQLSVPSKSWSVWVYAPKLSRETLFAIAREAERRERLATDQIRLLAGEREAGGAGRSVSEVAKALDAEEKLAEELRVFRREAERIAQLGWVPDLDDGMVLNAAPLADLFPAWKKAAEYRAELRAGKHEWATVARWSDRL